MKTKIRKLVALTLVFAMLLTVMPAQAFAVERARWFGDSLEQAQSVSIEEPVEEIKSPAIVEELAIDDELTVSIEAEEGAFPEGTEVAAEKVELADVQKAVDEAEDVSGKVLYAVDITFTLDGEELQPAEGKSVKVSFISPELKDRVENTAVVHIDDETKKAEPVETVDTEKEDEVVFKAEKFSIYAVLEPGQPGDNAQVTINFYGYPVDSNGKQTLIATYYVKNVDKASDLEKIITDPGAGNIGDELLFKGWSMDDYIKYGATTTPDVYDGEDYSAETEFMTVEDIRTYLKDYVIGSITQGDVLNFYAGVFKCYNITYFGNHADGSPDWTVALGADSVLVRPDATEAVEYKVSLAFTPTANQNFRGWIPNDATKGNITPRDGELEEENLYPDGTWAKITGDVVFGVDAPTGAWLVYNTNGKGGTYNAPRFFLPEEDLVISESAKPGNMSRNGYSFGGWYEAVGYDDEGNPLLDGEGNVLLKDTEFEFSGHLLESTNIYAKWIQNSTAPYTIVFWKQNVDRTAYDVAGSYVGNGAVGSSISYTIVNNGAEDYVTGVGTNGHYTGFCLDHEGNELFRTVFEKDEAGNVIGPQFDEQGNPVWESVAVPTITAEGDAVLNLYFDRIVYNLRFYMYRKGAGDNSYQYAQNSSTGANIWGIATYYGGTSLQNMPTLSADSKYTIQSDNNVDGYTGYFFVLKAYYGEDISSKWPKYDEIIGPANDRNPVSFVMMNGAGLKVHQDGHGTGRGSDTIKGVITRMDEKILGLTNSTDGNFLVIRFNTFYAWEYHIFYEQVPGTDYTGKTTYRYNNTDYYEDHTVTVRSSNTNVNEQNPPQYSGFDQNGNSNESGETGGGNGNNARWITEATEPTGAQNNNIYHVRYYYDRIEYNISYMDGSYFDGKGNLIQNKGSELLEHDDENIQQGMPIAQSYQEYVPSLPPNESGYVFDGWYLDDACTTPYTWTTMPVGGITVHAKWRQVEYRVFLHPNATIEKTLDNGDHVTERDLTLSWGDEGKGHDDKQQMCFRVAWGKKVSLPYGTRKGYEFVGWTTSDGKNYMASTELNDITVTDTAYNTTALKEAKPTDIIDKFGYVIEDPNEKYWISNEQRTAATEPDYAGYTGSYNADVTRDWITRKLELYAVWRQVVEGSKGIAVTYDVGEYGKDGTQPTDPLLYKDKAPAVGQDACEVADEYKDEYKFLYWVVQRWDATAGKYVDVTDSEGAHVTCYPGDTFTVLLNLAKADIHESHEDLNTHETIIDSADYTLQLRAEYGKKEAPKDTFFHWYRNWDGDNTLSDLEPIHRDPTDENDFLGINEPVDIYTLEEGIPERTGYIFLGWARKQEYVNNDPDNDPPFKYQSLDIVQDLYIRWIPNTAETHGGHYESKDKNGVWTEVTQVAADEEMPYMAWYAVWAEYFEVVYSSDRDNIIKVPVINGKTYNLVDGEEDVGNTGYSIPGVHDGFLYGGYYNGMPAQAAELNWDEYTPYTVNGKAMTPTANTRYNIKEVDKKENYLRCIYRYTYKTDGSNKLTWLCVFSSTDDDNYNEIGFAVDGVNKSSSYADKTVDVSNAAGTQTDQVTRSNFNGKVDEDIYAQISYNVICEVGKVPTEATQYIVRPYWVTKDGVTVYGPKQRRLSIIIKEDGTPVLDTSNCKEKTVP